MNKLVRLLFLATIITYYVSADDETTAAAADDTAPDSPPDKEPSKDAADPLSIIKGLIVDGEKAIDSTVGKIRDVGNSMMGIKNLDKGSGLFNVDKLMDMMG